MGGRGGWGGVVWGFFFNDTATTEIYTLSLHDALPISITDSRWDLDEAAVSEAFAQAVAFRKQKDYHRAEGLLREITRLAPGYEIGRAHV